METPCCDGCGEGGGEWRMCLAVSLLRYRVEPEFKNRESFESVTTQEVINVTLSAQHHGTQRQRLELKTTQRSVQVAVALLSVVCSVPHCHRCRVSLCHLYAIWSCKALSAFLQVCEQHRTDSFVIGQTCQARLEIFLRKQCFSDQLTHSVRLTCLFARTTT